MKKNVVFAVIVLILSAACSTEAALQQIFGFNVQPPVFYGCAVGADGGIAFSFSVPVTVESAYFDPPLQFEIKPAGEPAEKVTFYIDSGLPGGSAITADVLVKDGKRNTLNVLVPLRTRNNNVPKLVLSEIRSEATGTTKGDTPRSEFVEILITGDGNLGALRLFAAGNYKGKEIEAPLLEFPPVMVKKGEYVVVHTRTPESQTGCLDETGSNLRESGGYEATSGRDFWVPGNVKNIHRTDAIFILDQDQKIVDGVLLNENNKPWPAAVLAAAAMMEEQGAWTGSSESSAVSTDGITSTRTINRYTSRADTNSSNDWYISGTSKASPGTANN